MSELHDRFEKLARRGDARGADAVLDAAIRSIDGRTLAPVDASGRRSREGVSVINLEPAIARKRRRMGSIVTAGGVAASLFVGVLAIGSFVGKGGGAGSPEEAVRQLAAAVSHEDPIAAADVLAPEEVRTLRTTVDDASRRAQELSLAENASAPLTGLDLSVDNLNLSTESLADGYAKVSVVGGTFSARTDNGKFSPLMQHALRNSGDKASHTNLATLAQSNGLPTFVMTVRRDGHWYVSAAYTTLEYIREINALPVADFGSGLRATATLGADSPDAAVRDALHALAGNDWQRLIDLAPPDALPAYDYRAALTQLAADTKTNFTVDQLDTTATVDGDTAKVLLKASGRSGPDSDTWSVDGTCVQLIRNVTTDASGTQNDGSVAGTPASTCDVLARSLSLYTFDAFGNGRSARISVVREQGRWFVSPVGTALDLVDNAVKSVTRRDVYFFLNVPELLPPDGVLTLGRPITLTRAEYGTGVYSFEGHQGESLLGLATANPPNQDSYLTDARVFGPDGKEIDGASGLLEGQALSLPADGTYKFVFDSYAYLSSDVTVTIWDESQAPAAATNPPGPQLVGPCLPSIGGGVKCAAVSSSTTSTSVPGG